ncbi:hypothetical protein NXF25_002246 [Crotalus adamanteus]|uniref:Uncharacterized protein n=1 Tax=Crotalus adamanteus TaxID=8729 RepID=A0AAW1BXS0_CROAD
MYPGAEISWPTLYLGCLSMTALGRR